MDNFFRANRATVQRFSRRACLVAATVACGFLPNVASAAGPSLLEQTVVTQQGLAIGLMQTMIQSQLDIGRGQSATVGTCLSLFQSGGGSLKTLARHRGGDNFTVELYYDGACTKLYVHAVVAAGGADPNVITFAETLTYHGSTGVKLGTVSVVQNIPVDVNSDQISNAGTFTPVNGGLPVQFGFECAYPRQVVITAPVDCSVGVAQKIKMLRQDAASLASIGGTLSRIGKFQFSETFSGSKGKLAHGQNLGIAAPTLGTIKITGAPVALGSSSTQGSIGRVSPYMGAPASWTVTDTAHNTKFAITLHAAASPFFSGTIAPLGSSAAVATIRTDIAGNGSVTFSNNQKVKIWNWMLVN